MNESSDIPLTLSSTPDTRPCSIVSIIPNLGMSSCRGRAEAFARRLSSKLRTLGSQTDENAISPEDEPIINGGDNANTWVTSHEAEQTVTDLQPLRHESDSFFDFDCELESPGSPVDECEYLRLIETASNTPHNSTAESGYACASAASSHSSSDGPYFDATGNTDNHTATATQKGVARTKLAAAELPDYVNALKINGSTERLSNGLGEHHYDEQQQQQQQPQQPEEKHSDNEQSETKAQVTSQTTQQKVIYETTQTLPTTAPYVKTKDEISVQNDILSELKQQSDQITTAVENGHCNSIDCEVSKVDEEKLLHIITNGHAENGEDVLEIVLTEIDENLTAPTKNCIESNATEPIAIETKHETVEKDEVDGDLSGVLSVNVATAQEEQAKSEQTKSTNHTAIDTTDDEDDCRPQRVRRCSSLKTGKTPPGTPGRKKIVRFADVLGLDLADVKTFLDEIPTIPKSAFEDLEFLDSEPPIQLGPKSDKLLMPLFQQPGGLATFLDVVREKQVSLENAAVTDNINQTITGSVRVRNLDFHKSVHIRYSLDGWRSYADLQANYVENSCDGFSDKFTFVLFGNSLHIGQRLEFAVRFQCKGQQFWDNNYGANYNFQCLPTSNQPISAPVAIQTNVHPSHHSNTMASLFSPTAGDAWCQSFY